jgi:glucosamine 6-phosphate synthetase-like amidotransferase/phosphosugar isomerase protein
LALSKSHVEYLATRCSDLRLSELFVEKQHCLFLGRGTHYPIALEGALKLKEISYIHAEGYAAGELKHGPLALVDNEMPVVILAPNDDMLDKLKSNMEEVQAVVVNCLSSRMKTVALWKKIVSTWSMFQR